VVPDDAFRSASWLRANTDSTRGDLGGDVPDADAVSHRHPQPAEVPIGTYDVEIKLFADGAPVTKTETAFEIVKVGFEQFVANSAAARFRLRYGDRLHGMMTGWMASIVFRRIERSHARRASFPQRRTPPPSPIR
jgi:hypothetical protein